MMKKKKDENWHDGFDGFFNIEDMDEEFAAMRSYMEDMIKSMMSGDLDITRRDPFVYGFTMRVGQDGQPHIERFGNTHAGQDKPKQDAQQPEGREDMGSREPLTDIIESEDQVTITVEVPGVSKEDINLDVSEDSLVIGVDTPQRRYYKEISLPAPVDAKSTKATYNNGVLDITLAKLQGERKGTRVVVE